MGEFSYCCAICDQEILHGRQPGYQKFTMTVLLWPNGDRISGEYDGYGNVRDHNLVDETYSSKSEVKIVHQCCLKRGMSYEDVPDRSRHAQDQGWWPGERKALARYGPPDLSECREQDYVCFGCDRVWSAKWSGGVCPFGCVIPPDWKPYQELVTPLGVWLGGSDAASNGVGICRNPSYVWGHYRPGTCLMEYDPPRNCFRFGEKQLIRTTPDEMIEDPTEPFSPRCPTCHSSEHLEVVKLTRTPLQHLARALED